jgi:hypothetical protein
MNEHSEAFIGLDSSKLRHAVAIADGGRGGEVRFYGEIENTPAATAKLVRKLAAKYQRLTFCYEAGPTDTACIGRSKTSASNAWWWRRH